LVNKLVWAIIDGKLVVLTPPFDGSYTLLGEVSAGAGSQLKFNNERG